MNLTENALIVLKKRILARDPQGDVVETSEQMFQRVARAVAAADIEYGTPSDVESSEASFLELMSKLEFLPNSPALMNAGRSLGQLSACFVLPVEDSMDGIFGTLRETALIQKSGGGTGFSFSKLRPRNDTVESTHGASSGPVSFMRLYNFATEITKLGGKRAGANMAVLRVDHPDIKEFISAKSNPLELNTFNISVAVTDEFMEAVRAGTDFALVNPRTEQKSGRLNARDIFDRIVNSAWASGEPGVIFIDRVNRDNPTPELGAIESTNPCGEQPLLPYESCVLGSINLAKFADGSAVNYDRLGKVVELGVHFLDNIIDVSEYPISEIGRVTRLNRKIGLGVMGWADLLILLGIRYDSREAVALGEQVMEFISREAMKASVELAKKRGPFPRWFQESIYKDDGPPLRRNATVTTVAPTGTISLIADCSSGIEPIYAVAYSRTSFGDRRMLFVHPEFERYAKQHNFHSDETVEQVAESGSLSEIESVPDYAKKLFVTTHDIAPEWHVRMQAAFQKHIDAAVSKTINFPATATFEDVKKAYLLAYELGCKGITVYRDGSREHQVLSTHKTEGKSEPSDDQSMLEIAHSAVQSRESLLVSQEVCPDCGELLRHNGGCLYCSCGYSVCVQT